MKSIRDRLLKLQTVKLLVTATPVAERGPGFADKLQCEREALSHVRRAIADLLRL